MPPLPPQIQTKGIKAWKWDFTTVLYTVFNFVTSVGIVFSNKYVFHHYKYDYATLMTSLHFFGKWWWWWWWW